MVKKPLIHACGFTWNIIMEVWKIIFLSKWVICRFHVYLPGCKVLFVVGGGYIRGDRLTSHDIIVFHSGSGIGSKVQRWVPSPKLAAKALENGWLEYDRFLSGQKAYFQGRTVSSRECCHWCFNWKDASFPLHSLMQRCVAEPHFRILYGT